MGSVYRRWGETPAAQKHFSEALAINRRSGSSADVGKVLVHLFNLYQDMGEMERALKEYNEALAMHRAAGDKGWETNTLLSIGQVHLKLGDPQTALPSFESALAISLGKNPKHAGFALHSIGVARLALGEMAEAVEALEKALPLRREARDLHGEASTLVELGEAYQKQGNLERAESSLRQSLSSPAGWTRGTSRRLLFSAWPGLTASAETWREPSEKSGRRSRSSNRSGRTSRTIACGPPSSHPNAPTTSSTSIC